MSYSSGTLVCEVILTFNKMPKRKTGEDLDSGQSRRRKQKEQRKKRNNFLFFHIFSNSTCEKPSYTNNINEIYPFPKSTLA